MNLETIFVACVRNKQSGEYHPVACGLTQGICEQVYECWLKVNRDNQAFDLTAPTLMFASVLFSAKRIA